MSDERHAFYPTARLRFVIRQVTTEFDPLLSGTRVLQQWWESPFRTMNPDGEWRDVPLEEKP